jgi:polyketide cyclase/dehydrase/lipid transport protein
VISAVAAVVVNRPIAEVFTHLIEFDLWPAWGGGRLASMKQVTPGPPGPGTELIQVFRRGAHTTETTAEITELVENSALAIKSRGFRARYALESIGDGTRIGCRAEVDAQGVMALVYRLLLPRFLKTDLRKFKRLVEAL